MLTIIKSGPVVCKDPLTMTSIYCMAPLIPRRSTIIPLTIMSVCFKFSFIKRPNARPHRLPAMIRPMLMAVPKPIIYFPSLIVKVTLSIYFSITTTSKEINLITPLITLYTAKSLYPIRVEALYSL